MYYGALDGNLRHAFNARKGRKRDTRRGLEMLRKAVQEWWISRGTPDADGTGVRADSGAAAAEAHCEGTLSSTEMSKSPPGVRIEIKSVMRDSGCVVLEAFAQVDRKARGQAGAGEGATTTAAERSDAGSQQGVVSIPSVMFVTSCPLWYFGQSSFLTCMLRPSRFCSGAEKVSPDCMLPDTTSPATLALERQRLASVT